MAQLQVIIRLGFDPDIVWPSLARQMSVDMAHSRPVGRPCSQPNSADLF